MVTMPTFNIRPNLHPVNPSKAVVSISRIKDSVERQLNDTEDCDEMSLLIWKIQWLLRCSHMAPLGEMSTQANIVLFFECECVCTCLNVFVKTKNWHDTIFVGTNSYLWGPNAGPHKFEGIFEAENVAQGQVMFRVRVRIRHVFLMVRVRLTGQGNHYVNYLMPSPRCKSE